MNKSLVISAAATVLLVLPVSQGAWGKAHVPLGQVQVCTDKDRIKVVNEKNLTKELAKGGCRWTTCAPGGATGGGFNFVLQKNDACDPTDVLPAGPPDGDGFCDEVQAAVGAATVGTPACTPVF